MTDRRPEYYLKTSDVLEQFQIGRKMFRAKAAELGLGINFGGRAGYRYSDADMKRLTDSLRVAAPVSARRRTRRAA